MKKFLVFVFCIIFILAGCSKNENVDGVAEGDKEKKVKVLEVTSSKMGNELLVKADVLPSKRTDLMTDVSGEIGQLSVSVGQKVQENQLLVHIENKDLQVQFEQQKNKSNQLKVQVEKSKSDRLNGIESTERVIEKLEIQNASILRNLESMRNLFEAGAIAKEELNKIEDQYESAQLEMADAKQKLEQLKKGYDDQLLEMQAKEAEIAANAAGLQYDKTNIKAPFSGIVVDVAVSKGEKVNPGQKVVRLEQQSPVFVEALLTESDFLMIQGKKELEVYLPVLQKRVLAKVDYVAPSFNEEKQGFPIRVTLDNKEGVIKPGMSSHIVLSSAQVRDVITVPVSSVLVENEEEYLFVVSNNKAEKRKVTTGRKTDEQIEITTGLSEGESVVIVGQSQLEDGDTVNVLQ